MPRMRVLVAEDERRVADAVARGLRREGVAVDVAPDGAAALFKARVTDYDVVVLDRDLPEVHGDDVCRALAAEQPATKVLMLTASGTLIRLSVSPRGCLAKTARAASGSGSAKRRPSGAGVIAYVL